MHWYRDVDVAVTGDGMLFADTAVIGMLMDWKG